MKPRNSQLDTSGLNVNKLETLMVVACWSCCRNAGPCVWKLVTVTSQGSQLQVSVLFHINDFMLAGR